MRKNQRGFTLIELIMVIVLLGLLAIVAIPKYYDLTTDAKTAAEQGVVGAVRSGIYTYFAKNKAYPATLDAAAVGACAVANKCFDTILDQGGIQQDWTKASATTYTGPAGTTYTYTAATGQFV
ncbi:MAG TPA: prepilin-type N-terminal cleavage/methylation domain-containing protein [Candidatus Omnitrophota bacterium]|nr:prepilin-type N-terminal cleavage/methylation domain-containing protein [Candidatus Omnitrophota bacterium]